MKLLDEMVPFMRSARGVGLAAPQIGISGRFFVMDAGDKVRKVINPEIVSFGSNQIEMDEGCLSLPGVHRKVRRPKKINVRYTSETGEVIEEELKNLPARVFQHEFDHLNGTVFTDRLGPIQKKMVSGELERLRKRSEAGETLSADDSYAIRSSESFPDYIKVSSAADSSSESENKEALMYIVKTLKENNVPVIIANMPINPLLSEQISNSSYSNYFDTINGTDVDHYDLDGNYSPEDFFDEVHMTYDGALKFAPRMADLIIEQVEKDVIHYT